MAFFYPRGQGNYTSASRGIFWRPWLLINARETQEQPGALVPVLVVDLLQIFEIIPTRLTPDGKKSQDQNLIAWHAL